MSKNKKAGKKGNPNRPRSKNNPDGKRSDPQIGWAEYNKGRRAIINVKSNATPKGLNARAEMPGFGEEHPRTFHNVLRIRNSVKERLLLHEVEVRRGGPGPQAAHSCRRTAADVHLLPYVNFNNMTFA